MRIFTFSKVRILPEKPGDPGAAFLLRGRQDAGTEIRGHNARALYLYYTVFEDSDVIAVSARLFNGTKKDLRIRRFMSLQMDLPGTEYNIVTFEGAWRASATRFPERFPAGSLSTIPSAECPRTPAIRLSWRRTSAACTASTSYIREIIRRRSRRAIPEGRAS